MRVLLVLSAGLLAAAAPPQHSTITGVWRSVLDLAGGPLPFELAVAPEGGQLVARICNGPRCADQATVTVNGTTVLFDIADYAATITTRCAGHAISVFPAESRAGSVRRAILFAAAPPRQ